MHVDTRLQAQSQERHPGRNPQLGGGWGLGGIPAEGRPHEQRPLFLDVDANVLVPVWLGRGGRGDRPAFPIGRNRIFYIVPSHRDMPKKPRARRLQRINSQDGRVSLRVEGSGVPERLQLAADRAARSGDLRTTVEYASGARHTIRLWSELRVWDPGD